MRKFHTLALTMALSFASVHGVAAIDSAGATVPWSYSGTTGPAHWAALNPDFSLCAQGKMQSPIDVPDSVTNIDDMLNVNYHSAPLSIMENGPTALLLGNTQTLVNEGHGVQVNFAPNTEVIDFDGTPYSLVQLHFHTPSETLLQGHSYPAEIHLVHQGPNGQVAVIAVFIKLGKANPALETIIHNIPKTVGQAVSVPGTTINPFMLLPARQNYYHFLGSLTTPPCTEGLHWIVMINPITATQSEINALTTAAGGPNARPVQPLNQRRITASVEKI